MIPNHLFFDLWYHFFAFSTIIDIFFQKKINPPQSFNIFLAIKRRL